MNSEIKKQILEKIRAYDTVVISRHKRPDGDAVGSTLGLARVLRASYPEKRIFVDNEDLSEYVGFLGEADEILPEAEDYENALLIVIDTGTLDRVSNSRLPYAKEVIKIDHHIEDQPYGDLRWVEEDRSSACEMIVEFCVTFKDELVLNKDAAECLFTGMVTDSGRFRYDGTSAETMRLAAVLLECGIDTERIYANLYIDDFEVLQFQADMTGRIQLTQNGVAYVRISKQLRKLRGMSNEEAGNVVSLMDTIRGSLIWMAFIENDAGSVRVRLRSRFVQVQELATRYHGGGHACAAGATVYSREEESALLRDADELLKTYKEEHEGWL